MLLVVLALFGLIQSIECSLSSPANASSTLESAETLFRASLAHRDLIQTADPGGFQVRYLNVTYEPSDEYITHLNGHVRNLEKLVADNYKKKDAAALVDEAIRLLAHANHFYLLQYDTALRWYDLCLDRVECLLEASRLFTLRAEDNEAWQWAKRSLGLNVTSKEPTFGCASAVQTSRAALNFLAQEARVDFTTNVFVLGFHLMKKAKMECDHDQLVKIFESSTVLNDLFRSYELLFSGLFSGDLYQPDYHCISDYNHSDDVARIIIKTFGPKVFCDEPPETKNDTTIGEMESEVNDRLVKGDFAEARKDGMPIEIEDQINIFMLLYDDPIFSAYL